MDNNGAYCDDGYNLYWTDEKCLEGWFNAYFYSCVPPDKTEKIMFLDGVISDNSCWLGDYPAECY